MPQKASPPSAAPTPTPTHPKPRQTTPHYTTPHHHTTPPSSTPHHPTPHHPTLPRPPQNFLAAGPFPHKHAKYKSGGASSPSSTNFAATGAAGTAGMTSASSSSAAAPSPGTRPPLPEGQWVVTPGHLRAALEVSPRLAGPQSLARAHWRRVAMSAGDHPVVAVRGVSAAQGRAL